MKIYIACPELHCLQITSCILLSYYDIEISSISFRKITFKAIIKIENKQRRITRGIDHS